MIEMLGELYYIDFEAIDDFLVLNEGKDKIITQKKIETFNKENKIESTEIHTDEHIKHTEINGVRFELIRGFITDIGEEEDEGDYALAGNNLKKTSIRFKLAFNTLLAYDILKKID